jgi:hypothetical protein
MVNAVAVHGAHWRLVGPWYRWPRPGLPEDGRMAPPAIQKLAGNDFVAAFLAQPQHSLKYDTVVDVVQSHDLVGAGSSGGKISALFALNSKGAPAQPGETPFRARLAPGSLRKLYQPTHDRHYVVTCELHCDEPGFPRVARQRVCQQGFVVRRRRSVVPAGVTAGDIEAQAAIVRKAEADLYELAVLADTANDPALTAGLRANAQKRQAALAASASPPTWDGLIAQRRADLAAKRAALQAWYRQTGIAVQVEGWFPQPGGGGPGVRGQWKLLPDEPAHAEIVSGEQTYSLFPLVPDPRDTTHDAAGRTMYYGIVPTNDLQHDAQGKPHFDDLSTYEIRCFVRRHHDCPPRAGKQPDCHGELVWSRGSEAFRVAAPFDILGTANRPITIKMPDLRDLAAQAAMRPRGRLSPVRFVQPQHLSPKVVDGKPAKNAPGGEAICSFSIPLITIIALFLLNLFLPIVVFIFQLWFLLVFRFCIPPSIQLAMDVDAALAVTPPGIDLDADFAVEVSGVAQTAAQLNALLMVGSAANPNDMGDRIKEDTDSDETPALGGLGNNALGPLNQSLADNAALKAGADGALPAPPDPGEPLVYEDKVTPVWPAPAEGAA